MIYFDACYVAKFYLAEPDSPRVVACAQQHGQVACSDLGRAETMAVFHRKLRESVLDLTEFNLLCEQFELDCSNGLWQWLPITGSLVGAAVKGYRTLPANVFLRASDAIHLTCALEAGLSAVYTNDRHMITAAASLGLRAVTL